MATTRRSATFAGTRESLWATVGDPHHLPRWWPGVQRVEDVDPDGFTEVLESKRGNKTVRVAFAVVEQTEPQCCRWRRKFAGPPLERILRRAEVTIELTSETTEPPATRVALTVRELAGPGRFGTVRRTTGEELDQALAELGRIHV